MAQNLSTLQCIEALRASPVTYTNDAIVLPATFHQGKFDHVKHLQATGTLLSMRSTAPPRKQQAPCEAFCSPLH